MAKNKNIYKPRYKIAFQAKSKIWPYKNSRLRRFFSIRGRWANRCGTFRKNILVASTIKWTVARRYIRAYTRSIYPKKSKRYKKAFYIKQQVRHFYGKVTEAKLRSFYKTHLIHTVNRNKSFFGALECRADMFLFRLRLLPTIYACHQYVHHHGLIINRVGLEKSPHALIKIGDTISIPRAHWRTLYKYLLYRVFYRAYGKTILKKRQYKLLKKKSKWVSWLIWKQKRKQSKLNRKYVRKVKNRARILEKNKYRISANKYLPRSKHWFVRPLPKMPQKPKLIPGLFSLYKNKRKRILNWRLAKLRKKTLKLKNRAFINKARTAAKLKNKSKNKIKTNKIFYFKLVQFKLLRQMYFICWEIYNNVIPQLKQRILKPENKEVLKMLQDFYYNIVQVLHYVASYKAKFNGFWANIKKYMGSTVKKVKKQKKYIKRRPRILILILSFIYVTNTQWLFILENYKYKLNRLQDLKVLKDQRNIVKIETKTQAELLKQKKNSKSLEESRDRMKHYLTNIFKLESEFKQNQALKKEHFTLIFRVWIRKLFTKIRPRKRYFEYKKAQNKMVAQGNHLLYFLINRRYKTLRKQSIRRLKKVHWYLPNYIYFDLRTLQAILLYSPRSNEIVYPFKCSLLKIFSFYKSIGV